MGDADAATAGAASYHIDRVDFIPPGRCHFCGRPLPSCIAYIVRDGDGSEHPCGPVCVTTHAVAGRLAGGYPDFTKVAEPSAEWAGRGKRAHRTDKGPVEQAGVVPRPRVGKKRWNTWFCATRS